MPRDLASMIRFSIWSDMPRPCRPPISLASWTSSTGSSYCLPLTATGRPGVEADGDVLGLDVDVGVPELHAHDRLDRLQRDVEVLEGLRLVGGAPDVGVGGVRLLLAVAVGQVVLGEPLAHLGATAELVHEVGVQPGLVDAQLGVGEQAVAVEPLDVVALEGRAVAPDVDAVLVHRADQHRAGHRAAERGGVEVGAAAGADVEGAARPARRGPPRRARSGSRRRGRSRRRTAGRGRGRRRCRARRTGRCRRCRCTGSRPCRASRRRRPRCRGRRRRRCRRARRWAVRSGPCSCGAPQVFLVLVCGFETLASLAPRPPCVVVVRLGMGCVFGAAAGRRHGSWGAVGEVEEALLRARLRRPGRGRSPGRCRHRRWCRARRRARPCPAPTARKLRGAGRRAQHAQVRRGVRGDEQLRAQPGQPGLARGGLARTTGVRSPPSPGTAYTSAPLVERTLTASSSTRSRDSVACVTDRPSALSRSASSVCERTWPVAEHLDDPLLAGALGEREVGVLAHAASSGHASSSSQASTAFCTCRRFSASSQTTLRGPSITSAVISLPR